MVSLYKQTFGKTLMKEGYIIKSEKWRMKKKAERVLDSELLPNVEFVIKYEKHPDLNCLELVDESMPSLLGSFVTVNNKKTSKN